jgi:hypothetical protein
MVVVAPACNPSYLEADIGRVIARGQSWQILHKTPVSKVTRAKGTSDVVEMMV